MATAMLPSAPLSVPRSAAEPPPAPLPPDDVLYEVVDGQIVELPPMGVYETDIANLLTEAINAHARKPRLGRAFVELLFRINLDRNLKRRPDLAFVSRAKWPFGKRVPDAEAWDMVPDLAVEVVSDTNGANEIIVKVNDYFRSGSRLVWVVYPVERQVYVYSSATSVHILTEVEDLDGGDVIPGFRLPLKRLFEDEPDADPATPPAGEKGTPEG
jgi:Uma2 family endonuclease